MAFIYVITNSINGKQYVGKTTDTIENRFKDHIRDSRKKRCEKRPLYDAMNKYGIDNFSIEKLEECPVEIVAEKEQYWIDKLDTFHNGYNATRGGDGKILYDYKELVNKYLELNSLNRTAKYFKCSSNTIKTACKEYNIHILSNQESNRKNNSKKINMLDKQTNELLQTFDSVADAIIFIKGYKDKGSAHIGQVCNGIRKSAYGYKWAWAE